MSKVADREILEEFMSYPVTSGEDVLNRFAGLDGAVRKGAGLDQFVYVPGKRANKVLLVAHSDTYWDDQWRDEGFDIFRNGDGMGCGADDRAGCAILWLFKDSGHSLLILNGEEHDLRGAFHLTKKHSDIWKDIHSTHQFLLEFDRGGATDFKCYESCGTNRFRKYVSEKTKYLEPDRRRRADIVALCENPHRISIDRICAANLSIGIYDEHFPSERINPDEWQHTLNICRKWLGETNLPRHSLDSDDHILSTEALNFVGS